MYVDFVPSACYNIWGLHTGNVFLLERSVLSLQISSVRRFIFLTHADLPETPSCPAQEAMDLGRTLFLFTLY